MEEEREGGKEGGRIFLSQGGKENNLLIDSVFSSK